MKKRLFSLIAICILVLTSGCGGKKVTCTYSGSVDDIGYTVDSKVTADVNNDSIKEYSEKVTLTFNTKETADTFYTVLETEANENGDTVKQDGKKIIYTSKVSLDEEVTVENFKKEFEKDEYTCK